MWYSCGLNYHTQTEIENRSDAPFAVVRNHSGETHVVFDAFYTASKTIPTAAQFETLMDYCTSTKNIFEDVTDCWDLPWQNWRG